MLSGDIQLKERDRQMIDAAYRDFIAAGQQPQVLPTGLGADLGSGRQRLGRLFVIAPAASAARHQEPKQRGLKAGSESAKRAGERRARAGRLQRAQKASAVREMASARLTRAEAARRLGIRLGCLRRIADEHGIRFFRDLREGVV